MQFNPDETFWDDLLTYVDSGCVIPVLGQGAITYGDSDQPFYPWLARRLAQKLKVSVPEDVPVLSVNDIVCRHLLAGGGSNLVYLRISQDSCRRVSRARPRVASVCGDGAVPAFPHDHL